MGFPMIFAEALGAAGEELQIQVVRQQGRWGPGVSPLFSWEIHGFYYETWGKMAWGFPLESDRKHGFSYEKSGIKVTKWILPSTPRDLLSANQLKLWNSYGFCDQTLQTYHLDPSGTPSRQWQHIFLNDVVSSRL